MPTDNVLVRGWLRQMADARFLALRAIRAAYPPNHRFTYGGLDLCAVGLSQTDGEVCLIAVRVEAPTEHHFIPARLLFPDPPVPPPVEYHI